MGCFADDPAAFFADKLLSVHHLPVAEQAALQLDALQQRFAKMRNALPPLKALADASRTEKIRRIEDVASLLFPQSLFKSYPQHLIDTLRFPELTEWLSRITLHDLSAVKGRAFGAVDHWMDALDNETDLSIATSSGTTEALSLIPRSKQEVERLKSRALIKWQEPGQPAPTNNNIARATVWLSYAQGRTGIVRAGEMIRELHAGAPQQFIPLLPWRLSTDWQLYVVRAKAAEGRNLPPPERNAYLQQKMDEATEIQRTFDDRIQWVLQTIRDKLQATRVAMVGGPVLLHRVAAEGLKLGMEPGLAPGSAATAMGGMKGVPEPENMERTINRFVGAGAIDEAYGMTESSDSFRKCTQDRYHAWPWIVPMVFDAESGALLPRRGMQHGRAGFFDLSLQTRWGGLATSDRVSISWDRCACGRTTPQVLPSISRIRPPDEDEHVLGNASAKAVHAALRALNGDLA
jgi:hypothetical protein